MPEDLTVGEDKSEGAGKSTLGKLAMYAETGGLTAFTGVNFKASTAIPVGKFMRCVQGELKERSDMLDTLRKKYGKKIDGENGERWSVLPPSQGGDEEKWSAFRTEVVDLDSTSVDLARFNFRTADLKDSSGREANLPGGVILMLLDLGVFEE